MDPTTPYSLKPSSVGAKLAEKIESTQIAGIEKRAAFAGRKPSEQLMAEFEADRKTKTFAELSLTYGPDKAFEAIERNQAEANLESTAARNRDAGELSGDSALGLGKGVYNIVAGAARLGSELGPTAGAENLAASGLFGDFVKSMAEKSRAERAKLFAAGDEAVIKPLTELQSTVSRANRQIVGEENAADMAENARLRDAAVANGRMELLADAQRFGRDLGDGFVNTITNPTNLADTAVEQIPTLAMGPLAKGAVSANSVTSRASAIASKMGGEQGITRALLDEARSTLQGRAMAGLVATTEAGSAMNQAANEIMTMDRDELVRRYPMLGEQLAAGADEDVVRANLAQEVGHDTALMVAPIAAVAGKLTSRFELDPLSAAAEGTMRRAGSVATNVGGEMLEEGVQGASSEIATNYAGELAGDTEADLLEGAGISAGQGIAAAGGFAGALQAPAAVGVAASAGLDVAKQALRPVGRAIAARAEANREEEQAVVREQAEAAAQTRRETLADVDTSVLAAAVSEAETPAANALVESVESEPLLDPEVKQTLAGGTRVQALSQVIDTMREQAALPEDQRDGTQALNMMLFTMKTAGQLRTRLSEIDPASDEANAIRRTLAFPEVTEIEEQLPALIQPEMLTQMLSAIAESPDFASPRSQRAAEQIAVLAEVAPETVSSEAARSVALYQRLAPAQKAHLETVAQVAEVREAHTAAFQRLGKPDGKTIDIVTQEVTEKGMSDKRPSLAEYQRRILGAMAKGDTRTAAINMTSLLHFARHYQSKSKAFDQAMQKSKVSGKNEPLPYSMVDGAGKKVDGKAYAWFEKPGSQNLVDHIFNDANTVTELYNTLATAYPQLITQTKAARTPLAKALPRPGEPQFRSSTVAAPVVTQPVDATPVVTQPAPVAEPQAPVAKAETQVEPEPAPEPDREAAKETARQAVLQEQLEQAEKMAREKLDFETAPVDQAGIDEALALSEDDYLARVNPEGKVTPVDTADAMIIDELDVDAPKSAPIATMADGIELRPNGNYLYAVDPANEDLVVGMVANDKKGNIFAVHPDYQGKGIGKALMRELLVRKPLVASGGLSEAARKTRLSVLRDLRAERITPKDDSLASRLESVPKFLAAFSPRANAQSLLARVPLAMRTLSKALKQAGRGDVKPLQSLFLDQKKPLNATQISGLDQLINSIVPEVIKQLNANLERSIVEGKRFDGETGTWLERKDKKGNIKGGWLEAFVDGKQEAGVAQFSAAVLEYGRDEAGKPYVRYQAEVAQAMALASLQWTLKQVAAPINFDKDELAAMYPNGMPRRLEDAYNTMHFAVQPVRTIANDIVRMLGMQGKKDVSVTLTDGIAKSMALDVVTALHDADVLALRQVEGTEAIYTKNPSTGKREISGYKGLTFIDLKGAKGVEIMKTLRQDIGSSTLQRLLDPENADLPTFAPVTQVPTKVSGTEQKLSTKQQDQVRKTNATKVYRNPGLLLFVDRMGDRFLQLLGKDLVDQDTLHPDYAKTVKGVNEGLDYALEHVRDLDVMIHEHGDDPDNTAIHWSHYIVSNGRVMQNGFGGQGDKSARELFSANRVTGDLSTDQSPLAKSYYLSLAQALGIKTELKKNAAAVAEIRERLSGAAYQTLFTDIQTLQRGEGDLDALADSIFDQMAALLTKPGKPTSAKAIHALLTHARLLEARANGTAGAFTTYLGFELDGKTNGPINALMHFGLTNKKVLKLLRKGGLFVDANEPRTISDDVASPEGYSDLYRDVADESEARIGHELTTRENGSRESNMLRAGLRMLMLAGQVELKPDGSVAITREMAKAGMVPTVYGSGARGVANQMASDIQAALVKYLSDVANGNAELDESIVKSARYIMSQRWIRDDMGGGYWQNVTPPDFSRGVLSIKFNDDHFEALVDNLVGGQRIDKDERVPSGASGIMREAIEDQLRPVMETFKLVFKASRLQMFRFQQAYTAAYDAKRAELIEAGTLDPYHALSRADEEAIRDSLKDLMPAYPLQMTGGAAEGQGVFAGDKDYNGKFLVTTEKDGKKTTRPYQAESLVGGMRMDLNVRQYLSPGVKAAPLLTIGGGDATMMYLLSEMGELDGTLNVYDGWEVGIDAIVDKALAANEAVLQSWLFDLLGPVADSIQNVDGQRAVEEFGAEAVGETLSMRPYRNEKPSEFEIRVAAAIDELKSESAHRAWLIKTNKQKLFSEHRISVDQMSGGENPATRNYTEVGVRAPVLDAPAPIAGESAELVKRLGQDYQNGLAELGQFDLQAMLATFPFTNKVRAFVASRIAHLIPDDVRVFIGTPAQIAAKQEELFPGEELGDGQVPGVTYKGVAFLTVASEETLLHELVHVTTLHLVQRHYAKAKGLTSAQRDAVRELEAMVAPFLKLPASTEALRSAQMEVQLRMDEGLPALAINEMLAWSMANEQIATQLNSTEAPSVLKKVAKTIRALVRRLLGLPQNQQMESFLDQMGSNFQRLARRPRLADTHTELATFQRLTGPQGRIEHSKHLEMMYRSFGLLFNQLRVRTEPALVDAASRTERQRLMLRAEQELETLQNSGFNLSDREQHLFRMVAAVLGSDMALDPAVVTEFDKLFAHAMENLDEKVFMTDPTSTDPTEQQVARDQWSALFNDGRGRKDIHGRSVMLSNFVAMSLSHEGLRTALQQLAPPKAEVKGETFDLRLRQRVSRVFDAISGRAMGVSRLPSQKMVLDRLAWQLGELHTKAAEQAARNAQGNLVDKLEAKVLTGINRADGYAERVTQNTAIKGWIRQGVQWSRSLLNEEQAGANAEMGISLANQPKVPQAFTDLASELAGNTPSTTKLHRLVNLTRHAVSRVRQQLREEAPADVRAFFTVALSPATWSQLHKTIGQTDLQALGSMGIAALKNVISDAVARQDAIDAITVQLGPNQALYEAEARLLAQAIVSKNVAPRYRNAEALAHLFGQATVTDRQARRLAPLLDRLVSLYALEQLSDAERLTLSSLMGRDPAGMQKLLNTMRTLVSREGRKGDQRQRLNRWKGWVPGSADPRQQIVLATVKQAEDLVKRGYKMVGGYSTDPLDPANDLAYYAVNWIGGQATFNQGALQTVEGTLSGVDALTGQSLDPGMGTLIVNQGVVSSIAARHVGTAGQRLSPIYNLDGDVVAYERLLDPAVVAQHSGGRKDLALSIGIWLGRQAEEELAAHMNGQVVRVMAERWQAERLTPRKNEYVSINTSTDPIIADTWKAIPKQTQDQLLNAFGDKVMVRRDMLRNAVGYRSASIADAFTGLSTLPQPVRKAIVDAVYVLPGIDYKKIVAAEKAIQGAVGTAKDWIVVRSGVVAIANGVANMFQLVGSGINPLQLPKLIARKAQETEIYLRNEKRLSRIRVEMTAVKRPDERNRLLLEQQRLLDANSRLSIAPLIFAGELPTIAEGLSEHDEYTLTGDLMKWIEQKAEKLPQGVLTAAKIATISKDTALYQGLNRLVQFGDFTAKAVLYDKWIADGMSHEEALDKISERFVNYNLNAGRSREYLESMGLLWFWNYKLRVQKIVMASIRENPLRFVLSTSGAGLVGSDSLLTSFAPFVPWEYSVGPDMMFRAPGATLWNQLFN